MELRLNGSLTTFCLFFIMFCGSFDLYKGYEYPQNDYEYSIRRDKLIEDEKMFAGTEGTYTKDEALVNGYLQYLKWREYQDTKDTDFAPARPIEDTLDHIVKSELYRALKKLPKGGNMHSHENHQLSKRTLLEIVWNSTDFEHLWIVNPSNSTVQWQGALNFFINPPTDKDWINVKSNGYTVDQVLQYHTLLNLLTDEAKNRPTDSGLRWKLIDPLWMKGSTELVANINIKRPYIKELLLHGLDEGVQYIEARKSLGVFERIYELDPNATDTNGKKFFDDDGKKDIEIAMEVIDEVKGLHPEFIGMRRIVYSHRMSSPEVIREEMERVIKFREQYPDHIIGYDMVGEEDKGNALIEYLPNFLELYNSDTRLSEIPLYLHTAETSWAEDLISSVSDDDMLATIENLYEAFLLGAKRVGHGLGFLKHPYFLEQLKQRGTAIEICAVSNQILGLLADIRNHPAITFYRYGVPIVLGADDPGTFGYDTFTADWFEVYMGWGLDLNDLRKLARNSLQYSSLTGDDLDEAYQKWQTKWDEYILVTRNEACAANLTTYNPHFANIIPHSGAKNDRTKVHIFGRNFERAICFNGEPGLKCKFGDHNASDEQYITNHHVICEAPPQPEGTVVQVLVSLDGGASYHPTGQNFSYTHDRITDQTTTPPFDTSTDPVSSAKHVSRDNFLIVVAALVWYLR